jgi:hypothetical protein
LDWLPANFADTHLFGTISSFCEIQFIIDNIIFTIGGRLKLDIIIREARGCGVTERIAGSDPTSAD